MQSTPDNQLKSSPHVKLPPLSVTPTQVTPSATANGIISTATSTTTTIVNVASTVSAATAPVTATSIKKDDSLSTKATKVLESFRQSGFHRNALHAATRSQMTPQVHEDDIDGHTPLANAAYAQKPSSILV